MNFAVFTLRYLIRNNLKEIQLKNERGALNVSKDAEFISEMIIAKFDIILEK